MTYNIIDNIYIKYIIHIYIYYILYTIIYIYCIVYIYMIYECMYMSDTTLNLMSDYVRL